MKKINYLLLTAYCLLLSSCSQRRLIRKLQTDTAKPVLLFISLSHRRRGLEPLGGG